MRVNGEEKSLGTECTVQAFLEREGYAVGRVAVERNGEAVPRSRYETEMLDDGDRLEVVTFVGGG